jgi:hypothetical protein
MAKLPGRLLLHSAATRSSKRIIDGLRRPSPLFTGCDTAYGVKNCYYSPRYYIFGRGLSTRPCGPSPTDTKKSVLSEDGVSSDPRNRTIFVHSHPRKCLTEQDTFDLNDGDLLMEIAVSPSIRISFEHIVTETSRPERATSLKA